MTILVMLKCEMRWT